MLFLLEVGHRAWLMAGHEAWTGPVAGKGLEVKIGHEAKTDEDILTISSECIQYE